GGEYLSLVLRRKQVELFCARQRGKASGVFQPPHQPAFLIDEDQRRGRQPGDLGAERAHLLPRVRVVVVLLRPNGIIEQGHAAEGEPRGEFLQPVRNGLAMEAEDEELADLHQAVSIVPARRRRPGGNLNSARHAAGLAAVAPWAVQESPPRTG